MFAHHKLHPLLLPEILARVCLAIPAWESISATNNKISSSTYDMGPYTHSPSPQYRFTPKTLIAASKVCRTWYSIFHPALWTVYDGYAMSPRSFPSSTSSSSSNDMERTPGSGATEQHQLCVPDDLILAQSDHIRILLNDHRRLFGRRRYECPHLIDLTLHGDCPGFTHLVRSHSSQLKRLKWYGNVPYSGMLSDLEMDCVEGLTKVEELVLAQWDISPREFYDDVDEGDDDDGMEVEGGMDNSHLMKKRERITRRGKGLIEVLAHTCSRTLRCLTLQRVQGLDDLPADLNPEFSSTITDGGNSNGTDNGDGGANNNSSNNSDNRKRGLVLDHLEKLVVDAEWAENKALIHFLIGQTSPPSPSFATLPSPSTTSSTALRNFFPCLKILDLGAGLLEDPVMMAFLEDMLPLVHPGLVRDISIIDSSPWARYHLRDDRRVS
ncbi:MAG: hypothetical protein J3R72DRAFT_240813 [Linnemannia gamsii]|nr:MAG: hypothetical protein J3R72DRAFT_240813 [Linnemannia gamsii]